MKQVHFEHCLLTAGPSGPGGPSISIPLTRDRNAIQSLNQACEM